MGDVFKKTLATLIAGGILANIAFAYDVGQRFARIETRLGIASAAR